MFLNGFLYNTTPDTGSLENAISADEVRRLQIKTSGSSRKFLMADGSRAVSLGTVRLKCAFARSKEGTTWQSFNVFDNLAVPVIIGKTFLDVSKTLTLHRDRLEIDLTSAKRFPRVMHLDQPRQLMRCFVNGKLVYANPDTGSEVDLMSPNYPRENMLNVEGLMEGEDWVQFANGRTARLLGKVHVDFDIYDGRYGSPTGQLGHSRTFYLLDGLTTDILLGEAALFDMQVFTEHKDSFVDLDDCGLFDAINLVTWFDKRGRQMSDTLALFSSASSQQSKSVLWQRYYISLWQAASIEYLAIHFPDLFFAVTPSGVQTLLNKLHARELHQRELASQKLAALPATERSVQERLEQARRLEYDMARDLLIQRRNDAALGSHQHTASSTPP